MIQYKELLQKKKKAGSIAIFIKLLETKSTANNLLGLFLKSCIRRKLLFFELMAFLRSVLLREKKATSEPEIKEEQNNKKTINAIFSIIAEESENKVRKLRFN